MKEKKRTDGRVMGLGGEEIDRHSGLFSAKFCAGAVEVIVLADQGADSNFIPPSVLPLIKEAYQELAIGELKNHALLGSPKRTWRPLSRNNAASCMLT